MLFHAHYFPTRIASFAHCFSRASLSLRKKKFNRPVATIAPCFDVQHFGKTSLTWRGPTAALLGRQPGHSLSFSFPSFVLQLDPFMRQSRERDLPSCPSRGSDNRASRVNHLTYSLLRHEKSPTRPARLKPRRSDRRASYSFVSWSRRILNVTLCFSLGEDLFKTLCSH